jgi:hypothetical protein
MSAGRYIMRPRVFQGRVFAGWALAASAAQPTLPPEDGVAVGFRSRIVQQGIRSRLVIIGDRSRTIEGRAWR